MKRLFSLFALAAVLACGCASAAAPVPGEEICKLQAPPETTIPESMDVLLFFVYPKTLPENYTGCRVVWMGASEGPMGKFVIHFNHGAPAAAELYTENKLVASCQMDEKKKATPEDDSSECGWVENFIKEYPKSFRPYLFPVPPDRDPRKVYSAKRDDLVCDNTKADSENKNTQAGLTPDQATALSNKVAAGDKAALEMLRAEAQKGNPSAQNSMGWLYANGHGVEQDYGQAAQWYCKGAQQENAKAQINLSTSYYYGRGVAQDAGQAVQWARKAAEQGFAAAQVLLGYFYEHGQGVPRDYDQAAQWYRKAAEQGSADAQSSLANLYYNGSGVPRNGVAAYALYSLAAARGDKTASNNREALAGSMADKKDLEAGDALARKMDVPGNFLKALDEYLATCGC